MSPDAVELCRQATESLERAEQTVGTDAVRNALLRLAREWGDERRARQARKPEVRLRQLIERIDRLVADGGKR